MDGRAAAGTVVTKLCVHSFVYTDGSCSCTCWFHVEYAACNRNGDQRLFAFMFIFYCNAPLGKLRRSVVAMGAAGH